MSAAWFALVFIAGIGFGWVFAHSEIARECDRLGGFYVGQKIYKCVEIKDKNE